MKIARYLLIALFVFITTGSLFSSNTMILLDSKKTTSTFQIQIQDFDFLDVKTPEGVQLVLTAPGAHQIIEKGAPDLPKLVRSIIIPDTEKMALNVISAKYEEFSSVKLAPSKGHFSRSQNPDDIPYTYGDWYETDAFYPGELAKLNTPYIIRDFRGQALDIYPFQYNPVSGVLRVYSEIVVEVVSTGKQGENILSREKSLQSIQPEFQHIYNSHFINFNKLYRYTPLEEEGDLLIIAYDDFINAMEPFVEWKNTVGLRTQIIPFSEVGSTPNHIKDYIANHYNNPAHNLTYVLLVGDAEQIPVYDDGITDTWGDPGYSDKQYAYIVGSDYYQDIFIGRFSAENISHVETQVQRSIEYEQAYNFDNDWLNVAMGIARDEGDGGGHNGEADDYHIELIRDRLLTYNYEIVHQDYDHNSTYVESNTTATQISNRINAGAGMINYCNHGSPTAWSVAGYSANHVNALTNTNKLPFIWAVACVNGQFRGQTCYAETWLRATHNGNPSGAVAVYMSTVNQPWTPPMDAQDEFNDIMIGSYTDNIKRTFGGVAAGGVFKMLDINGSNKASTSTAETWTIFGDPSLKIRTDDAVAMNVNHDPDIMFGPDFFEITVDADDAFAALTKDGEIIATATEDGGTIYLAIDEGIDVGDIVRIAITGYNKIPYIEDLEVIASGPFANFEVDFTHISKGETVIFTDISDPDGGSFSQWAWNFGEGAIPAMATGVGPHTVVYSTAGIKTVSLLIDDTYERVKESYITVDEVYHTVNFHLDMNDATGFNPEIHQVFVAGSFAGNWAVPGSIPEYELKAPITEFHENFDRFEDFSTELEGWITVDIHGNNTWGATDFNFPGEGTAFAWKVMNPAETDPSILGDHPPQNGNKYMFSVASNPATPTGEENKWLISPSIKVTDNSELSLFAKSITDKYGLERLRVHVSTSGTDISDFTSISTGSFIEVPLAWTYYDFNLSAYAEQEIHIAIENVSNDAFILMIDDFKVSNLYVEGENIYSNTLEIPQDEHEYKYFFVENGTSSWDNGEWAGDPNRNLSAFAPTAVHDKWGVLDDDFLMGDVNEDGIINVLDVVLLVNLVLNTDYNPNGDFSGTGAPNVVADIVALVNHIIGTPIDKSIISSQTAYIYAEDKSIILESDGTLAALMFEIESDNAWQLNPQLNNSNLNVSLLRKDNIVRVLVYSLDNTPISAGSIPLIQLNANPENHKWGALSASNIAAEEVDLLVKSITAADSFITEAFEAQIFPNPVSSSFGLNLQIGENAFMELSIKDMAGRKLMSLPNTPLEAGSHNLYFNESQELANGVYLLMLDLYSVDKTKLLGRKQIKMVVE